jgi:hypothetical protein
MWETTQIRKGIAMVELLVQVLILFLVFGAIFYLITLLPLPEPYGRAAQVIIGVIFIIILLYILLGLVGGSGRPLFRT